MFAPPVAPAWADELTPLGSSAHSSQDSSQSSSVHFDSDGAGAVVGSAGSAGPLDAGILDPGKVVVVPDWVIVTGGAVVPGAVAVVTEVSVTF